MESSNEILAFDTYQQTLEELRAIDDRVEVKKSSLNEPQDVTLPLQDFLRLKALAEQGAKDTYALADLKRAHYNLKERYYAQREMLLGV